MKKIENEQTLPDSALSRVFDCTGTSSDGTKGFIIFYINSFGQPSLASRTSNMAVDMALHKLIELFLESNKSNNQIQ